MRLLAAVAPFVGGAAVLALVAAWLFDFSSWPGLGLLALFALLVLPVVIYLQALKHSESFYDSEIAHGLTRAFESDRVFEESFELDEDRLIVLSDLHKGTRDGADDFWRSEPAYLAALAYYLEMGHRLVVLGDVEELWENRARDVLRKYRNVLELEGKFHAAGRYARVWGNHDDDWRRSRLARKHLYPALGFEVDLWEAIRLTVTRGGEPVGTLFLAHGHQGTADSQILASVSRPAVMVFGFLQRKFKRPWNTPAIDANLRERHDHAMFRWARGRAADRLVLIAGHTHRPVFWNTKPTKPSEADVAELEQALERERAGGASAAALARAHARLEHAKGRRLDGVKPPRPMDAPCYFNTGCCAFADGDITGIEVAEGELCLVRWPDDAGEPLPKQLVSPVQLETIFDAVEAGATTGAVA